MALLSGSVMKPFRQPIFRRIWLASLFSNFGLLIQGVGAAWAMTQLDGRPEVVALVQTAGMAPVMLLAVPAGALADMLDRRRLSIAASLISLTGAAALTFFSFSQMLTPSLLLAFCFWIGAGMAVFGPAWSSSVGEQVPEEDLPNAIALNGISFNLARSFGPALGGLVVAIGGSVAAFLVNALFYVPILIVLAFWRRVREIPRLPPERFFEAISSGLRYLTYSPTIRRSLIRAFIVGFAGSAIHALLPLVARDNLFGDARTYGLLLGCFGMGSVIGAILLGKVRERMSPERTALISALLMSVSLLTIATSSNTLLTCLALGAAGIGWILILVLINIGVQLTAPRWVLARALAGFQSMVTAGVALGSWFWGSVAGRIGMEPALLCAGILVLASPLFRRWFAMPQVGTSDAAMAEERDDPDIALALTGRSGPIVIEIEYHVDPQRAREFHALINNLKLSRRRNGARIWSIARDVQDSWLWIERFHFATWLDYLRHRNRPTQLEMELQDRVMAFHEGPGPVRVRRMLERPFGSVRWKAEAPDHGELPIMSGVSGGP